MLRFFILSILFFSPLCHASNMQEAIYQLQKQWAIANYQTDATQTDKVFETLTQQAEKVVADFPNKAEPLIWQAIIISSDAGKNGGLSALGKVKQARELLKQAESLEPNALNGSVYTSLGSLYYQVPGWPLGFGDHEVAEKYLKKALKLNPNGIDPNYFYGDYLIEEGHYQQALNYLNKALKAKPRINRPLADKGRRSEIQDKIKKIQSHLKG